MAIRVNHSTHFISPPSELTNILSKLAYVAALAKSLGLTDLFNQARDTYRKLSEQWDANAKAQAKSNSHTDWLGGGDTYLVHNSNNWEFDYSTCEIFVKSKNKHEQQIELNDLLKELNR